MKRLLLTISLIASLAMASGCYDDSAITARLDKLDERVAALNSIANDFGTMKLLVSNLEKQVLVREIIPEGDKYRVVFANGTIAYICDGEKGPDGDPGQQGAKGPDGPKGQTGQEPVISVKAESGIYYWTVDGQWMLDSEGKKIPASGTMPEVKIENNTFLASFDGGKTWKPFGSTSANIDASIFLSFSKDANSTVIITLKDGTHLEFPVEGGFAFTMDESAVSCKAGDVIKVKYNIFGCDNPEVYCHAEGGYVGKIVDATKDGGAVEISVTNQTKGGRMLVYATNGDNTLVRGFEIEQEVLEPCLKMLSEPIVTYASIAFKYTLENIPEGADAKAGICWSTKEYPSDKDSHIDCPNPRKETVYQAVPAALLDIDTQYHFCGYVKVGNNTYFSKEYTA
ncbi:MAG: DUF4988 domain-containing protein, partial [Bacteroidales bacterium]|nr:DUF4988 domain-containing protein [Bacteroidales bacterium]